MSTALGSLAGGVALGASVTVHAADWVEERSAYDRKAPRVEAEDVVPAPDRDR